MNTRQIQSFSLKPGTAWFSVTTLCHLTPRRFENLQFGTGKVKFNQSSNLEQTVKLTQKKATHDQKMRLPEAVRPVRCALISCWHRLQGSAANKEILLCYVTIIQAVQDSQY